MESVSLEALSAYQRLIVERALVLAKEMERTALEAPHGQALDQCEQFLMRDGRELLRACLEGAIQAGIDAAGKKISRADLPLRPPPPPQRA